MMEEGRVHIPQMVGAMERHIVFDSDWTLGMAKEGTMQKGCRNDRH